MNTKDRFAIGVQSAFRATFHKATSMGRIGYLHDELEVVGNDINYLEYKPTNIKICKSKNDTLQSGVEYFMQKKYKEAYKAFEQVEQGEYPEVNYCKAMCMLYGKGIKMDANRAFKLLKDNAGKSPCCLQLMARCYIEGRGTVKNRKHAYESLLSFFEGSKSDVDIDWIQPDLYHFCGEYEIEQGLTEQALKHLKIAAIDMDYGFSYYLLGKVVYNYDPEQARIFFDKAKSKKVNVSAKYFADERGLVCEEEDGLNNKIGKLENITGAFYRIVDNIIGVIEKINNTKEKKVNSPLEYYPDIEETVCEKNDSFEEGMDVVVGETRKFEKVTRYQRKTDNKQKIKQEADIKENEVDGVAKGNEK